MLPTLQTGVILVILILYLRGIKQQEDERERV